ncbi:DUF5702 domain-containing protein [Alkaliphilus serpentinus]|uniref:Uncharacterized protein n=1 Tax=Alkaliphilus serpentinus TaxID=1482731 RepID=A0A833HR14_9FIRM|nr:DUF5702 domain-containing protein [Alkaliphilus serpentinus]KAB3532805.1 hypothetical protein F8153_01690 [Alkaliphilus serpentinus]
MYKRGQRGAISVYLSIVFIALIILTGVIVDGARIRVAEAHLNQAATSVALSILSEYEGDLKDYYGIFAVNLSELEDLDESLMYYFNNSLNPSWNLFGNSPSDSRYLDFFDYQIDFLEVNYVSSNTLLNTDLMTYQILDYMKYRAPVQMGEEFLSKLDLITKVGNTSELLKSKIKVEEKLSEVSDLQLLLHLEINGPYDETGKSLDINGMEVQEIIRSVHKDENYPILLKDYYIKNFNQDPRLGDNAFYDYFNTIKELENNLTREKEKEEKLDKLLKDINKEIERRQKQELDGGNSDEEEDSSLRALEDQYQNLQDELENIRARIIENKETIQQQYDEIFLTLNQYIEVCKKSKVTADKLLVKLENVKESNEELLGKVQNATDVIEDIKSKVKEEGKSYQKLYSQDNDGKDRISHIKSKLDEKVRILGDFKSLIEIIQPSNIFSMSISELSFINYYDLTSSITSTMRNYESYKINYAIQFELAENLDEYKSYDNRKEVSKKIKIQEDEEVMDILLSDGGAIALDLPSKSQELDSDKLGTPDFTSKATRTEFLMEALDFMTELPKRMSLQAMDNIYINEYALGTFNNAVRHSSNNKKTDPLLRPEVFSKYHRDSYFSYEVEYLLQGRDSQNTNLSLTKGEILLYRFGLNLLHLYANSDKLATASAVATAVAGWWTFGAGMPIAKTLILCGWAMAESILDLEDLMKGERVPFFKMKNEWKLDLRNAIDNAVREGVKRTTDYAIDGVHGLIDQTHDYVDDKIDGWIDDAVTLAVHEATELDEKIEKKLNNDIQKAIYQKVGELLSNEADKSFEKIHSIRQQVKEELSHQIEGFKAHLKEEMEALASEGTEAIQNKVDEIFKENNIVSDKGGSDYKLSILSFSYHDYLRLFLLFRGNEKKVKRIQDLIQVNMNTNLKELYSVIELKTEASIKYLFLTRPFMAKSLDFNENRHKLKPVVIYKGY